MSGSTPPLREQLRAAALAVLVSVLFLGESLLPGRVLLPYAPVCFSPWYEAAAPEARAQAVARAVPHLGDKWLECLPFQEIVAERWRRGEPPVWTSRLFGGQMLAGDVVPQPFHPLQALALVVHPWDLLAVTFLLMQAATGLFLFRFLRLLGLAELPCHLGMASWCAGLWVQARVHHPMVLTGAFAAPLAFEAVERLVRRGGGRGSIAVLALALGSGWLGGFTQVAVQTTWLVALYALYRAWPVRRDTWRRLAGPALGVLLGCLLGAVQTVPAAEAAYHSTRGRETAAEHRLAALQPAHLLGAVIPELIHPVREFTFERIENTRPSFTDLLLLDTSQGQRFNHTETAFYAGLVPLLMALSVLFRRREGTALFFSTALVVALLLAFGLWPFLEAARFVPGLAVGDPNRYLFTASLALSVLAAVGFDRALRGAPPAWIARALAACAVLGLAVAAAVLVGGDDGVTAWFGRQLGARYGRAPDEFRAALAPGEAAYNAAGLRDSFLLLGGTALLAFLCLRARGLAGLAGRVLVGLTAGELLLAGHGRCLGIPRAEVLTTPPVLGPVVADPEGGRFQRFESRPGGTMQAPRLIPPNLPALLGIADAGGYSVFSTRRLEEFWNAAEPGLARCGAVTSLTREASLSSGILDAFAVRWILSSRVVSVPGLRDVTPADAAALGPRLYRRESALPRAYLVHRTRLLPDRDERLRFLSSPAFQPRDEVVLEDVAAPALSGGAAPDDRVTIARATDEEIEVLTESSAAAWLVLGDPWYPGWRVEVDAVAAPLQVAHHALRAVHLPPGAHRVRFTFASAAWRLGSALSALAAVATVVLLGMGLRSARRGDRSGVDGE